MPEISPPCNFEGHSLRRIGETSPRVRKKTSPDLNCKGFFEVSMMRALCSPCLSTLEHGGAKKGQTLQDVLMEGVMGEVGLHVISSRGLGLQALYL